MTEQNDDSKKIPEIICEEDIPFSKEKEDTSVSLRKKAVDPLLSETKSVDEKIKIFRFRTGKTVLFVSMCAMALCVLVSIVIEHYWEPNEMVKNAFEAFKLITMTVLGYIFGSNNSN